MKIKETYNKIISKLNQQPFEFRSIYYYELICFAIMHATVPIFAYGYKDYNIGVIRIILLTILTLYSGYFAALIWNDINDYEIDKVVHPDRYLPQKKISRKKFFGVALIFSFFVFLFSMMINVWCFLIVGFAALFVAIHDKFLKRHINIPAFSEIFTPVQWIIVPIFGFVAVWSYLSAGSQNQIMPFIDYISIYNTDFQNMILLVLFTYFADDAHDIGEGIHDVIGDKKFDIKTYSTSFGIEKASKISFFMYFISGISVILLFFNSLLSPIFLILFFFIWINILYNAFKLIRVKGKEKIELGGKVGKRGFDFLLLTYSLIFVDMLINFVFFS